MHLRIVAVGKVRERGILDAIQDYYGRIKRYTSFDEVELRDADEAELIKRFERAIPADARVVALEVEGKMLSSEGLAELIRAERDELATKNLVFLIGGAYGLPAEIRARASIELSLSKMTLPHRLARLFLAEQVYRAFTILRGEPYSH